MPNTQPKAGTFSQDQASKPLYRPLNPNFSSGPCAKRPGWDLSGLSEAWLGRSHRAGGGKLKLKEVTDRSAALLGLPNDWVLGIVPASDTGAVETALWSLIGPRPVDVIAWESFGMDWAKDLTEQLNPGQVNLIQADYGLLPDLDQANPAHDCVFTWNGTTSGVVVPHMDWVSSKREGLVICDATSIAFAAPLDFDKIDVCTWSWQKVMGGEAAHGMLALSPRAIERLERHKPSWPVPKLFRLTKGGQLNGAIFEGATINTPSMLAVEDALDGLKWAESLGGAQALYDRVDRNFEAVKTWVEQSQFLAFLAEDPATVSKTSVCLKVVHPVFLNRSKEQRTGLLNRVAKKLEEGKIAFDIKSYRTAPLGFRIWCGATVEASDVETLMPWLDWFLAEALAENEV